MRNRNVRALTILITSILLFTPLTGSAKKKLNEEVSMNNDSFSIKEASMPIIPVYPFSDNESFSEDGKGMSKFGEWWSAKLEQQMMAIPNLDRIRAFIEKSTKSFFEDRGDTNVVFSPINLWFYLQRLSTLTKGSCQAQILDALGMKSESSPEDEEDVLYKALYWDDGSSILRLASSLWLDQRAHISGALAEQLATEQHTSVFRGPMGQEMYNEAFRAWLNAQTNDILADVVNGLTLDRETDISLCTTLYLRCPWSMPFSRDETCADIFYTRDGEVTTDFLRKEENGGSVYRGTGFSSVIQDLQSGYVTLILPDMGKDIGEILKSEDLYDFLFSGRKWADVKSGTVKLSVPRMDVTNTSSLMKTLNRMGVTDVFDPEKASFTGDITSDYPLKLASIDQLSRLIMNEDGVEAASIIVSDGSTLRIHSEEEIEFTLNRPFLFAVSSDTGIPLFIGTFCAP